MFCFSRNCIIFWSTCYNCWRLISCCAIRNRNLKITISVFPHCTRIKWKLACRIQDHRLFTCGKFFSYLVIIFWIYIFAKISGIIQIQKCLDSFYISFIGKRTTTWVIIRGSNILIYKICIKLTNIPHGIPLVWITKCNWCNLFIFQSIAYINKFIPCSRNI